ncbi:MAG: DoxX family protein, partial [Arenicella sp.]|nr:DoxX family protein [Arenicella sp.]
WAVLPLANLAARIYVGLEFFRSGLAKVEDFEGAIELFEDDWALPFLSAEPNAYLATAGELVLPVLLILGLFTRFAAAGLLVMALVIELWVFPGTAQHYYWMIILAMLMGHGGHKLSLDRWLLKEKSR